MELEGHISKGKVQKQGCPRGVGLPQGHREIIRGITEYILNNPQRALFRVYANRSTVTLDSHSCYSVEYIRRTIWPLSFPEISIGWCPV